MEQINELHRRIPVWAKLIVSLALLGAVGFCFFLALGRPVPTPALAAQLTERAMVWGPGATVAQGELAGDYGRPGCWMVRRSGEQYLLHELERVGPLWRSVRALPVALSEAQPMVGKLWMLDETFRSDIYADDYVFDLESSRQAFLAICPGADRVSVLACWVPRELAGRDLTREESLDYLKANGAEIPLAQTGPGSGVWTARGAVPAPGPGGDESLFYVFTAWDVQGGVLAQFGPGAPDPGD